MAGSPPEPGTNRLLLGPPPDDETLVASLERASASDRPPSAVIVSTRRLPSEILDQCRTRLESVSARTDIVSVSDTARRSSTGLDGRDEHDGRVETVAATDLNDLGIAISASLSGRPGPVAVWFDSLTSLLRLIDREDVFRFLHMMTTRVERAAAVATYHADPAVHEAETITTLAYLFDDVIDAAECERECEPIR